MSMNRRHVIENDIVIRYLRGALSEEEQAAFEIFYLDDQETLDELEIMLSLAEHLNVMAGLTLEHELCESEDPPKHVNLSHERTPRRRPWT